MSTVKVLLKDGQEFEYVENTFQHQIGNGAVQIMFLDGGQVILNDFARVDVIPSEEEKADFQRQVEAAEAEAQRRIAEQEAMADQGSGSEETH